jgi:hypothetical protein
VLPTRELIEVAAPLEVPVSRKQTIDSKDDPALRTRAALGSFPA